MAWNENTLMGVKRFLDRFTKFISSQKIVEADSSQEVKLIINKLIDAVTRDLKNFKYNTAIAKMMEALNSLSSEKLKVESEDIKTLVKLIAPFAPYTAEEIWSNSKEEKDSISVHLSHWPEVDKKYLVEEKTVVMVAINGKVRSQLEINTNGLDNKEKILSMAKSDDKVKKWISDGKIVKEIYVPGKMINLVVK
jgi:leucyl-tRNA synthetase